MQPPSLAIALLRASDKEKHGVPLFFYFYFVRRGQEDPARIMMWNGEGEDRMDWVWLVQL